MRKTAKKISILVLFLIISTICFNYYLFTKTKTIDNKNIENVDNSINEEYNPIGEEYTQNNECVVNTDNTNKSEISDFVDEKNEIRKLRKSLQAEENNRRTKIEANIREIIRNNLGDNSDKISVSFFDIKDNVYIGNNDDNLFTAGSTIKVAVGIVLSDMLKKEEISLDDTMNYDDRFYEDGAGVLQDSNLLYKPLSIKNLMSYMIIDSDNIATNMLINKIGYIEMKDRFSKILGHAVDKNSNSISSKEAYIYLKKLYDNKDNNPYYETLKELMRNTTTHDRIDKYLPQDKVAHKIGDYNGFVNDIGIIYAKRPYILTIYTDNIIDANELIANLSKDIYEAQNE